DSESYYYLFFHGNAILPQGLTCKYPQIIQHGFACYGGYCVFLGLSEGGYTGSSDNECHTAKEGSEFFKNLANCSDQKMMEYESLQRKFKELRMEYEQIPHTVNSEIEYLKAEAMFKKLESNKAQIESFRC
ncbi:MAG: hypothetical protein EB149_07015, partial [Thaumarchaeota archaeon]|nr:hypothetical protein [Nitrososphaerota archaeon]